MFVFCFLLSKSQKLDIFFFVLALQGTVKRGRSQGRQKKSWEDNIREWTGLELAKSHRVVPSGKQGKMEETGCEIIIGAPVTLVVKG